ncbi:lysine--tRNA ligase [Candidatus Parcubacteria bacterium]|nr:MAG: lysine--tRNA ligase [Candidatus Parcubacteria bacterium]
MSEADIRAERLKKLEILEKAGMEAYPAHSEASMTLGALLENFETLVSNDEEVTVVGRVMALRGQGAIMFADIFDGSTSPRGEQDRTITTGVTGRMQAVVQKGELDEEKMQLFADTVDIGDFVQVSGVPFKTKRGEQSVQVCEWRMIAKSVLPLPSEHFGIKDEETRLRERTISILLDPEMRAMIERRSKFWQTIRTFYLEHDFLEVETPVLENSPGGADARPFLTHHNALDIDVSLRISLELWLKRLLVAGFPKVFEIGRIFRNEGQSREHLQDYTQWESYEAYKDMRYGMKFVQDLYRRIAKDVYGKYTFEINGHTVDFAAEWTEVDFCKAINEKFGIDPLKCSEGEAIQAVRDAQIQVGERLNKARAVDHLWKAIRKSVSGPAFLVNVPVYLEPLAKRSKEDDRIVERFQILLAGSEMGKGFSELNDPQDQRARFEEQQKLRDAGDDEAQRLDEDYVRTMEYGMPPSFGFGMSERLFAFLENKPAHEAQLFPLLRPKQQ